MNLRNCLPALLLLASLRTYAQDTLYPPAALQSDLRFFQEQLANTHPALYRYTPQAAFNAFFDSLYQAITDTMTEQAFLSQVSRANGRIMDGHTMVLPSEAAMEYANTQGRFFPFGTAWIQGHLYITENGSLDSTIQAGAEIINIDGLPAADIMQALLARQIHDGYNQTYPVWILDHYFGSYYRFAFGERAAFNLVLRVHGANRNYTVAALYKDTVRMLRAKRYPQHYPSKIRQGITMRVHAGDVAVLSVKSFDTDVLESVYEQSFKPTMDSLFMVLERMHIQRMVLDLRDNQGGDFENGRQLLSLLLKQPARYLPGSSESQTVEPAAYRFAGKLVVLVNGGSFSNTGIVSSILKLQKRAVFVGTETGGNPVVLSGNAKEVVLPNTGLRAYVATENFLIHTGMNTGRGLQPEYVAEPGIAEVIAGKDVVLEKAMGVIDGIVK